MDIISQILYIKFNDSLVVEEHVMILMNEAPVEYVQRRL